MSNNPLCGAFSSRLWFPFAQLRRLRSIMHVESDVLSLVRPQSAAARRQIWAEAVNWIRADFSAARDWATTFLHPDYTSVIKYTQILN